MTPIHVPLVRHQDFQRRLALHVSVGKLLDDGRGLLDRDHQPDRDEDEAEAEIRTHHRAQLAGAHGGLLGRSHVGHVHRLVQFRQDEGGGQEHADVRADRVERLREVEPSCRGFLRAKRKYVGIGGRLENRAPGGDREQSDQERLVGHDLARRIERDRAGRCEKHTGKKPGLIAEPLIDERCGDRQQEVRAEVRQLHERGLEGVHLEDALEARDHRRGEVGGDTPCGEATDKDYEQHPHPWIDQPSLCRGGGRCVGGLIGMLSRRHGQYLLSAEKSAARSDCDLGHATQMS